MSNWRDEWVIIEDDEIGKGENNGRAKLTKVQVDEIRKRYAKGGITQRELASEYSVNVVTIGRIIRGKNWK